MAIARLSAIEVGTARFDRDCRLHWDTWGGRREVNSYVDSLAEYLNRIAQTRERNRLCDQVRSGCRRIELEKHVVIYRRDGDHLFIS